MTRHYNNYVTDESTAAQLSKKYDKQIRTKRDDVIDGMLKDSGAIAYRESKHWGGYHFISDLGYPIDSELVKGSHIKINYRDEFEGQQIVCARGKLNSKKGVEFNRHINNANTLLADLPKFTDWIVKELGVMVTGLGGEGKNGVGVEMISTYGGKISNLLAFAIPNEKLPEIPSCMSRVTYGYFYDLVNQQNAADENTETK